MSPLSAGFLVEAETFHLLGLTFFQPQPPRGLHLMPFCPVIKLPSAAPCHKFTPELPPEISTQSLSCFPLILITLLSTQRTSFYSLRVQRKDCAVLSTTNPVPCCL
nr:hypothetical protein HmN_000372200 [Hymenolepis microstoma]